MNYMDDKRTINLCYTGYENGEFDETIFNKERITKIRDIIRFNLEKRKTINVKTEGSYQLKHAVERFDKTQGGVKLGGYVSNGELIYAMIQEGFDVQRDGRNAYFNVTTKSAKNFCNKFRG